MKTRLFVSAFLGYLLYHLVGVYSDFFDNYGDYMWIIPWVVFTSIIYVIFLGLERLYLKFGKH